MKRGLPSWLSFPYPQLVTQGMLWTIVDILVNEVWQDVGFIYSVWPHSAQQHPTWRSERLVKMSPWFSGTVGQGYGLASERLCGHLDLCAFGGFKYFHSFRTVVWLQNHEWFRLEGTCGNHVSRPLFFRTKSVVEISPSLIWARAVSEQAAWGCCGLVVASVLKDSQGSYLFTRPLGHWGTNKRSGYLRDGLMGAWSQ